MYINKYIHLEGVTDPQMEAGALNVAELPCIEETRITEHTRDDESRLNKLWAKVLKNTEMELSQMLRHEIMTDVEFREILVKSKYPVGKKNDAVRNIIFDSGKYGTRLRNRNVKGGELLIDSLVFSQVNDGIVEWGVIDLRSGITLHTDTLSTSGAGLKKITINKAISTDGFINDYFVYIKCDGTTFSTIPDINNYEAVSDIDLEIDQCKLPQGADVNSQGLTSANKLLYVDFTIRANFDLVTQQNALLLKNAAYYLAGALLLQESLTTQTFTTWANTNREVREEFSEKFYSKAKMYVNDSKRSVLKNIIDFTNVRCADYEDVRGNTIGSFI